MAILRVGFSSKYLDPTQKRLFIVFTNDSELKLVRSCSEQAGMTSQSTKESGGNDVLFLDIPNILESELTSKFTELLSEKWPKLSQYISLIIGDEMMIGSLAILGIGGPMVQNIYNQSSFQVEDGYGVISTLSASTLGAPIKGLPAEETSSLKL